MLKYILVPLMTTVIGLSAAARSPRRQVKKPPAAPQPAVSVGGNKQEHPPNQIPEGRISIEELKRKLDAGQAVLIIDNRAGSSWLGSLVKIKGALHIPLSDLESRIEELPRDVEVVTYCTRPDEGTSASSASTLKDNGFAQVRALRGGFDAWEKAGYPVEPKNTPSPIEKRLKRK